MIGAWRRAMVCGAALALLGCSQGSGLDGFQALDSLPEQETDQADPMDGLDGQEEGLDLAEATDTGSGLLDLPQEFSQTAETLVPGDLTHDLAAICQGNNDGVLQASEVPALEAMGAVVAFTRNPFGSVVQVPDLNGSFDNACNCYRWDFRAVGDNDGLVYDGVMPLDAFWFDSFMADGDFVQSFGDGLMGAYSLEDDGLYLVGLASQQEDYTALSYKPPVPLLKLPMELGDSWTQNKASASGLYEGQSFPWNTGLTGTVTIEHTFQCRVDRKGFVQVPAGEFPVWRVMTDITMEVRNSLNPVPVATVTRKVVMWVSECYGLVARVGSREGETEDSFTQATEFRRLGFPE